MQRIFYYKSPESKNKKAIKWKAPLKKIRCESQNVTGTQCSRISDIGEGLCSWHLSTNHNLCIRKLFPWAIFSLKED